MRKWKCLLLVILVVSGVIVMPGRASAADGGETVTVYLENGKSLEDSIGEKQTLVTEAKGVYNTLIIVCNRYFSVEDIKFLQQVTANIVYQLGEKYGPSPQTSLFGNSYSLNSKDTFQYREVVYDFALENGQFYWISQQNNEYLKTIVLPENISNLWLTIWDCPNLDAIIIREKVAPLNISINHLLNEDGVFIAPLDSKGYDSYAWNQVPVVKMNYGHPEFRKVKQVTAKKGENVMLDVSQYFSNASGNHFYWIRDGESATPEQRSTFQFTAKENMTLEAHYFLEHGNKTYTVYLNTFEVTVEDEPAPQPTAKPVALSAPVPTATPAPVQPTEKPSPAVVVEPYSDVPEDFWGAEFIYEATSRGYVKGVGQGLYKPDSPVTRAEFVQMIQNLAHLQDAPAGTAAYVDVVSGAWYYDAVMRAKAAGLLDGLADQEFRPDIPILREEMAGIAVRLAGSAGVVTTMDYIDLSRIYQDYDQIASQYQQYMQTIYKLGIMQGISPDTFSPKGQTTRAQAAVVLMKTASVLPKK